MKLQFVILAAACALVHGTWAADAPHRECRWTDEAIKLDGTADEPAWREARVIDDFRFPWQPKDAKPTLAATKARLLWDREYLYVFADLNDADLQSHVTEHDGKIWNDDVLELFLKPADEKPGYYEFQVNPAGAKLDMFIPKRSPDAYERERGEGVFHFDAHVALRGTLNKSDDADRGWSVEGRIAWRDLMRTGGRPEPGETWRFALCRYDYAAGREPELSTCAPLSSEKPDFHRHEDYAKLRFIGPDRTAAAKLLGQQPYLPVAASRVIGSPDPPLPYRAVRAFPNLKLNFPIAVYAQPGDGRLLIIDQAASYGNARIIRAAAAEPEVKSAAAEPAATVEVLLDLDESAYGLALHPQFAENGYVYVGCNGPPTSGNGGKKTTRVIRYTMSRDAPHAIDSKTAHVVIEWPSDGHNGGDLVFGNDGMLYVTSGDGTSDSDTDLVGQDMTRLTAKVLRIDVDDPADGKAYSVPVDNPFVGQKHEGAPIRPETWAYGLRNPWRICVDHETGAIWVGNNGQDLWEQAYRLERGANYGWSVMEGGHVFYADRRRGPTPFVPPTVEHPHSVARSLTGGVVYRGKRLPELHGAYIYGDYSTGKIWSVLHDGKRIVWHKELADTTLAITGFGIDRDGELLVCDHRGGGEGGLYRLESTPRGAGDAVGADFPRKLSETGLFQSVAAHQLSPGAIPYSVNSPLWSDGTYKERYLVLPPSTAKLDEAAKPNEAAKPDTAAKDNTAARIDFTPRGTWNFPDRTVLVKSFAIETASANGGPSRRWIETRLLTRQEGEWAGYSYIWNNEQTEATLVGAAGADRVYEEAEGESLAWHYPSRTECMVCHSRAANFVLGLSTEQLNRTHEYPRGALDQLAMLERLGLLRVDWQSQAAQQAKAELAAAGLKGDALESAIAKHTDSQGQRTCTPSMLLAHAPGDCEKLVDPGDENAPVEKRARSYLHANCAQCHQPAGGGNAQIDLRYFASEKDFNAIDVAPMHDTYGIAGSKLVAPGDPERSLLLVRMSRRGRGQMPQLATTKIDEAGAAVIRRWIEQLANGDEPGKGGAHGKH